MDSPKPARILLVEDNPDDVEITRRALSRGRVGHEVWVARDGQEALEFLHRRGAHAESPRPDLVLLDVNLPRRTGLEVLEEIKADAGLRTLPVIVLTSSRRDEDVERAYFLGANTYFTKPVGFEEFFRVVTTIRDYWIVNATLPLAEARP